MAFDRFIIGVWVFYGLFRPSVARAETWVCNNPTPEVVSSFRLVVKGPAKIEGTLTLNPGAVASPAAGNPVPSERIFNLQAAPNAIQHPLQGLTLVSGRADSLNTTQVNLHLVSLLETEFATTAEVYTELGSGQGVFKDSFSCLIERP